MWLDEVGTEQWGLVTWQQGVANEGESGFKRWIADGRVRKVRPSVYAAAGAPESWEREVLAACLQADAVGGGRSAARLKGFPYVPSIVPEILVAAERRLRIEGVRVHRTNFLPPHHIEVVRGIPTTTGARTMVDLSGLLGDETVWRVLNEAERRRCFTFDAVRICLDEVQARGRRRIAHLRPLLDLAMELPTGDSQPEVTVLRSLLDAGVRMPEQQLWVVVNGKRYCIDLAWRPEKVGLEYEGWDVRRMRLKFDTDRDKIGELEIGGWLIVPVTSAMSKATVVDKVQRALASRSTSGS